MGAYKLKGRKFTVQGGFQSCDIVSGITQDQITACVTAAIAAGWYDIEVCLVKDDEQQPVGNA